MTADHTAWLIIGLGVVALWHFVYEAILLPSLLQDLGFRLFQLRDRLRALKAENPQQCPDATFQLFDAQLSWQMDHLHRITFSLLHRSRQFIRRNPLLRHAIEARLATLDECQLHEYKEIRAESARLFMVMLSLNSGGLGPYLVPMAVVGFVWNRLSLHAQRLFVMPAEQIESIQFCPA